MSMLYLDEIAVGAGEHVELESDAAPTPVEVLIVPGWRNSGHDHWQTHWQQRLRARRVQQRDWTSPRRDDWIAGLQDAMQAAAAPVVLVAHSLGCIAIAHWVLGGASAWHLRPRIRGALLVAPADVERSEAAEPLRDFAPVPRLRLPFPALVVASSNDPYCSFERAARFAQDWGAGLLALSNAGHINADSGHQRWDDGPALLNTFDPLGAADSC